ncbi:MAG: EVE domain-containing protein [Myxococcales bacterium]
MQANGKQVAGARAWVGVVSESHVRRGVKGGFAQLCHGKSAPLTRMNVGDYLVYYSPRTDMHAGEPLRAFTALGKVSGQSVYPFDMGGGFVPKRRDITYAEVQRRVPVQDLNDELDFIREHANWGMLARRGHFEINLHDLHAIARAMGVVGFC